MKHLKSYNNIFESLTLDDIKVSNWIIDIDDDIGKVISIKINNKNIYNTHSYYTINYINPEIYTQLITIDEIIFLANTKEECELYLQTNKYNL